MEGRTLQGRDGSFDGDDEEDMGYDAVNQLHFGGGFERKASQGGEGEPEAHKTKKEVTSPCNFLILELYIPLKISGVLLA